MRRQAITHKPPTYAYSLRQGKGSFIIVFHKEKKNKKTEAWYNGSMHMHCSLSKSKAKHGQASMEKSVQHVESYFLINYV